MWLGGRLISADEAEVSVFDRSVLYGEGLFETMRVYGGMPFAMSEHLGRLLRSAEELGIAIGWSAQRLEEAVMGTVESNHIVEGYVRLTASGGAGDIRVERGEGTVFVYAGEGSPYAAEMYERGVGVVIAHERRRGDTRLAKHKTTSYLANLVAWREAKAIGADEAVFLTPDGEVAEGTRTNVFAVIGGRLVTPPLKVNILAGITRAKVLEVAEAEGVSAAAEVISVRELREAGEVFITSSLMELMPVAKVEGWEVGECPGEATLRLLRGYRELANSR